MKVSFRFMAVASKKRGATMKSDPKLNALAVHLHGERIGVINRLAGDFHLFAFEQEYLDNPDRTMLSLSFKGQFGGLVTAVRPVGRRVPSFFSNLLPEGHLRTYLAEQAGVKPDREFFLLAALGADLPGAVTATPFTAEGSSSKKHAKEVEQAYERSLDDNALRFSLAGIQLKFSAVMEASGGLTIPAHGIGGSWIVKLPSTTFSSVPENEYLMLELARAVGIKVPEVRLVPVSKIMGLPEDAAQMRGNALVVRRFDRAGEKQRVHMEDFAQVFGLFPDGKYGRRSYANIAAVLRAEAGEESTYEFVRRLAFSVVIGNGDMHLKNWSLLYPDTRRPVLSPAYDFVSTFVYIPGDKLALSFGGSRSLGEITVDQVRRFADTAHLAVNPVWQIVREVTERTADAWNRMERKELLPSEMQAAIGKQIQSVLAATNRS
jgi:serine/threonine-protein kinase HipA